jgi:dolichyl-phosphate beta-glucosyltransferase
MKRFGQFTFAFAVSGLLLYALLRRFDLQGTMDFVRSARQDLLTLGGLLMVVAYVLRAVRWRIWERSLSYWDSFRLILIGFMGNNVLPARLGEILRAHCAAAKTPEDRGRTTALASIAAERVLDGLILASFGLVSITLVTVDARLEWALFAVSFAFAALGSGLLLGIRFHERIRTSIAAAHRKFPGHVTAFVGEKIGQFLDGLLPLGTPRRVLGAVTFTTLIWGIEVGCCYFIGTAVWEGMTVSDALLLLVVVNFASLVPFTMGGIGTIEAVAPFFLISAGVAPAAALAIVLLQHAAQYLFTTITGALIYVAGGFYRIPLARPKTAAARASEPVGPHQTSQAGPSVVDETRSRLDQFSLSLRPAQRETIQLSIVIPAYNEQARLPRTVLETIRWCSARNLEFELVIADDGSRDETLAVARLFEESDARIRVLACPHMGKGATVRFGVLNARGRVVMFMDADGATPLDEVPKLLAAVEKGSDVAIGSRVLQRPGEVVVKTSWYRRVIGRIFAFFVNLFAIEGIADTQCGFKAFRRAAAEAIFSRQKTVGFAFDVEILFIARRLGLSIEEIPVNWHAQPGSKVNLVTDSIKMLWDISHIRWLQRGLVTTKDHRREGHDSTDASQVSSGATSAGTAGVG